MASRTNGIVVDYLQIQKHPVPVSWGGTCIPSLLYSDMLTWLALVEVMCVTSGQKLQDQVCELHVLCSFVPKIMENGN